MTISDESQVGAGSGGYGDTKGHSFEHLLSTRHAGLEHDAGRQKFQSYIFDIGMRANSFQMTVSWVCKFKLGWSKIIATALYKCSVVTFKMYNFLI